MDWLLFNGHIETFDASRPTANAVAISGGRFVAVGEREVLDRVASSQTRRTDLAGATVFPGFCDTHMHLQKVAHDLAMVHLGEARSLADVLEAVNTHARRLPGGTWIRSFGDTALWHERNLSERRLPSSEELDRAAPDHPVFLYRRPQRAVLNRLAASTLASKLQDVPEDQWDSTKRVLRGPAVRTVNDYLYHLGSQDHEHELALLEDACVQLLGMGITTIVDPGLAAGFDAGWELYKTARSRGTLPQRVRLMNRFDYRRPFAEELDRLLASSALPLEGDDRLQAWAVKLLLDGEFSGSWMRKGEELAEPAIPRYSVDEIQTLVSLCADRGWPLCVHVMGGAAIEAVIDVVRSVRQEGATLAPGQVTLAHAFLMDTGDMLACRELGIGVSVQPLLAYVFVEEMREAWGPLAGRSNPLASMMSLDVEVAAGSDTLPCPPLLSAKIAVTRQAWDGSSLGDKEALDPAQAIGLFTRAGGAYIGADVGTIAPASAADFVVWSENPLAKDPNDWPSLTPTLVAIDGRTVWSAPDAPSGLL